MMPLAHPQVISGERHALYQELMRRAENAYNDATRDLGEYWWSLFTIKHGRLWEDGDDLYPNEEHWVRGLSVERFGPSAQTFYDVWRAFQEWQASGITNEEELKRLLGERKTATVQDLNRLYSRKRKDGETTYEMLEEHKQALEKSGETQAELIRRLNSLSAKEARAAIRVVSDKDHIYFVSPLENVDGVGLVNVRLEQNGLVIYEGTLEIRWHQTAPEEKRQAYLPDEIARELAKRFRVDY